MSSSLSVVSVIVVFVAYTALSLPIVLAYPDAQITFEVASNLELVMDVFFMLDIVVNFRTAYIQDAVLVVDKSRIAKKYLGRWFAVDLVASVPWELIFRIYAFDVIARDAHCIRYRKAYNSNPTLTTMLGVSSIMPLHETTLKKDGSIHTNVRGSIDTLGLNYEIDIEYTQADCVVEAVASIRTDLASLAVAEPLLMALMRRRFAEERALDEQALRETSFSQ